MLSCQQKQSEQVPCFTNGIVYGDDVLEFSNSNQFIQGDMLFDQESLSINPDTKSFFTKTQTKFWPNNKVYYVYESGFSGQAKVSSAIAEWESKTSLDFVYGTGNGNYIQFHDSTSNCSFIGMIGGPQKIGLIPGSGSTAGTAMHEIGHAIGLQHEHCRYDRSGSIVVYTSNIDSVNLHNFNIKPSTSNAVIGAIDFSSIMMYGSYAFSNNGLATMKTPEGGTWTAQRLYLSDLDVDGVSAIYGPPYHHLEESTTVIQDYVDWINEVYETNVTYYINIYANKQFTQGASLKYARPITLYKTHYYYDPYFDQTYEEVETQYITIPAGSYFYNVGTVHNIERYQMSNPVEIDKTWYSILAPNITMYN